jgi:hypothetical protein
MSPEARPRVQEHRDPRFRLGGFSAKWREDIRKHRPILRYSSVSAVAFIEYCEQTGVPGCSPVRTSSNSVLKKSLPFHNVFG